MISDLSRRPFPFEMITSSRILLTHPPPALAFALLQLSVSEDCFETLLRHCLTPESLPVGVKVLQNMKVGPPLTHTADHDASHADPTLCCVDNPVSRHNGDDGAVLRQSQRGEGIGAALQPASSLSVQRRGATAGVGCCCQPGESCPSLAVGLGVLS